MKASFPRAASPAQQPGGPEDEDGDTRLDEDELYGLAPSYLGKVWPRHLPAPSTPPARIPSWPSPDL